jgi:hypothetical protein
MALVYLRSMGCSRWKSASIFLLRKPFTWHAIKVPEQAAQATPEAAPVSARFFDPQASKEPVGFVVRPMWPCPRLSEHAQMTGQNGPQGLGVWARLSAKMGAT